MLNARKQVIVGQKRVLQAVLENRAETVIIALDAKDDLTAPLRELCAQRGVETQEAESKRALGALYGVDTAASAVAILKHSE